MIKSKPVLHKNQPLLQIISGAFVVLLFFGIVQYSKKVDEQNATIAENETIPTNDVIPSPVVPTADEIPVVPAQANTVFKDGTYAATGSYSTPGGREQIAISLTIKNDVVTTSTFTPKAISPTSAEYQKEFAVEYKQFVTGRDINTLSLGKVAGSSLTNVGFNAAVEQIKIQAEL